LNAAPRTKENRGARMVEQPRSYQGEIEDQVHAEVLHGAPWPDARAEENARRMRRTRAEHDARRGDLVDATERLHLDADHPAVPEENPPNERHRAHAEVLARPDGRRQIAACDAHPLTADLVHRVRAVSRLRRIIRVGTRREPELRRRVEEGGLPLHELARRMPPDRHGAVLRVPLVSYVEIVLESFEIGQAPFPAPLPQAKRCPFVVIVRLPPERDARVYRGGAAHDAAAREPEQ
jgi:hypothetical protein